MAVKRSQPVHSLVMRELTQLVRVHIVASVLWVAQLHLSPLSTMVFGVPAACDDDDDDDDDDGDDDDELQHSVRRLKSVQRICHAFPWPD